MSLKTYANLLPPLKLDLIRDLRTASRTSGGRVDPEVMLALTIRMSSGALYLDLMMLFRVASSAIYASCSGPVSYIRMYDREAASYYRQSPDILVRWTRTDCVGLVS
jgi:hypothetical protein